MPRKPLSSPEEFAGFDDVELIGQGTFADVYRARDRATNQAVALKVLHSTIKELGRNSTFQLETRALGTLSAHPHIVTMYRTEILPDGRPMLVMELCETSLTDRLERTGPIPPREVVRFGIQVCGALETAHRSGILHRDIKPQNLLITRFGSAQLADFGVADMKDASGHEYAVSGLSVLHAPPELLWGNAATARSDVYALASTLYELLCGRSPFFLTHEETPAAVRLRILNQKAPSLSVADMPPRLWDVLERALSKEPEHRHESAMEFARDLRAIEAIAGWPVTECIVDGANTSEDPDVSRIRPRMTGAVLANGSVPTLGGFGKGFGSSGINDSSHEEIVPLAPSIGQTFLSPNSPGIPIESTEHVEAGLTPSLPPISKRPDEPSQQEAPESPDIETATEPSRVGHVAPEPVAPIATETLEPEVPPAPMTPLAPLTLLAPLSPLVSPAPVGRIEPMVPDPTPVSSHLPDTQPRKTDAEIPPVDPPDNPSAVPGEVLWGFTPRTGLTGTIQLDQSGGTPAPNSPKSDKTKSKKSRFGRDKDKP